MSSSYLKGLDSTNRRMKAVNIDSDGRLQVDINTMPAQSLSDTTTHSKLDTVNTALSGTLAVSGSFYPVTQPVSIASAVSVNDSTAQGTLSTIASSVAVAKSQTKICTAEVVAAGNNIATEIDLDGFSHLTIFGETSLAYGSMAVEYRDTTGSAGYLDSDLMTSSSPDGSSNNHFVHRIRDVGVRYLSLKNVSSGSQTVSLFIVKHR